MRLDKPFALSLLVISTACAQGQGMSMIEGIQRWKPEAISNGGGERWEAFRFDVTQHTCALYVAVRSAALEKPIEFGREVDDSMVHWNMCPGGKMVACTVAPTANGDTIVTGIPWSH